MWVFNIIFFCENKDQWDFSVLDYFTDAYLITTPDPVYYIKTQSCVFWPNTKKYKDLLLTAWKLYKNASRDWMWLLLILSAFPFLGKCSQQDKDKMECLLDVPR